MVNFDHPNAGGLLERLSHADVGCFIVQGNRHFPFEVLKSRAFEKKYVVAVVDWACPFAVPRLAQVLTDYHNGMRQIANHLLELGHRDLLVVGTGSSIEALSVHRRDDFQANAFLETWPVMGGTFRALHSHLEGEQTRFDEDAIFSILDSPDGPTAILAFRDVEAYKGAAFHPAQAAPLASRIAIVGYYNTPWSMAGDPSITSWTWTCPQSLHTINTIDAVLADASARAADYQSETQTDCPRIVGASLIRRFIPVSFQFAESESLYETHVRGLLRRRSIEPHETRLAVPSVCPGSRCPQIQVTYAI